MASTQSLFIFFFSTSRPKHLYPPIETQNGALKMKKFVLLSQIVMGFYLVIFLAGCAVGPDYEKPVALEPAEWLEGDPAIKIGSANYNQWWEVFNDPALDVLIETAYQENLGLRLAGIRIIEARAELAIASGNYFPQTQQVRAGYSYTRASKNSPNAISGDLSYSDANVGFDAAWELDFWGKFRRAVESGQAVLDASIANYDDILVSLTAEVARAYVQIRTFELRLDIARENVLIQKRSFDIAKVRFDAGEVTELDVAQARSLLKNTEASIPLIEAGLRRSKNALSILLGKTPDDFQELLRTDIGIPTIPEEITLDIPADLLRRRPDVRLAEYQVMAQSALIGVAKADLFPHFTLFGSIGLRSSDLRYSRAGGSEESVLGSIFKGDSLEIFGGPSLTWDVLNYGRIKNRVRVQDARLQQLIVNYQNTVLRATQEVEDSLVSFLRSRDQQNLLEESVTAAKRSVEISTLQYREGIVDYQRVLDAQRFQSDQQDFLADTQGTMVLNLISLYKAMGGGWEIRQGKDFVPDAVKEEMRKRTNWGNFLDTK